MRREGRAKEGGRGGWEALVRAALVNQEGEKGRGGAGRGRELRGRQRGGEGRRDVLAKGEGVHTAGHRCLGTWE